MAANFVKGFVSNFVKNSLNLEKQRPASRKGGSVLEEQVDSSFHLIPSTPRYCTTSAKLLRMVGLWDEAKYGKFILYGKTLLAWYHAASQLPWENETHLIFTPSREGSLNSLYHLAESLYLHLKGIFRDCAVTMNLGVDSNPELLSVAIMVERNLQTNTLVIHFMKRNFDDQLVRAVIDGGNSQTYVFANRADVVASIQESGPKNALAKLPIHKNWRYDKTLDTFFKPSSSRQAFMWPPSVNGAKFWGLLAIVLVVAYVIGMYVIPSIKLNIKSKKKRQHNRHANSLVQIRDAPTGRSLRGGGHPRIHTQTG